MKVRRGGEYETGHGPGPWRVEDAAEDRFSHVEDVELLIWERKVKELIYVSCYIIYTFNILNPILCIYYKSRSDVLGVV